MATVHNLLIAVTSNLPLAQYLEETLFCQAFDVAGSDWSGRKGGRTNRKMSRNR